VKPAVTRATISPASDQLLIAAACAALATLVPVALYQTGLLDRLPDPPLGIFDSERITTSSTAHPLGIPDALLGLGSFGTTLTLALLARRHLNLEKFLGVKLTLDASAAAFNASRQVVNFRRLCSWCTGTAIAAGVMAYAGRKVIGRTWGKKTSGWVRKARKERKSHSLSDDKGSAVIQVAFIEADADTR
jgi:uncharacterized membrane protein